MGCVLAVFAGVWGAITGVSLFAPELAVTISYALVASGLGMAAVGLPVAVEVPVWVAPAVMGTAIVVAAETATLGVQIADGGIWEFTVVTADSLFRRDLPEAFASAAGPLEGPAIVAGPNSAIAGMDIVDVALKVADHVSPLDPGITSGDMGRVALTSDGLPSFPEGTPMWITEEEAREAGMKPAYYLPGRVNATGLISNGIKLSAWQGSNGRLYLQNLAAASLVPGGRHFIPNAEVADWLARGGIRAGKAGIAARDGSAADAAIAKRSDKGVVAKDGTILPTIPFRPMFVTRLQAKGLNAELEAKEIEKKIKGKNLDIKWWDRWSGTARVCWKESPETCGTMESLFLYCWDWEHTGVPDAIPKLGYPGQEAFLPNGSISIPAPGEYELLHGVWAAPIAGSCKYWARDFRFPNLTFGETTPKKLEQDFKKESWLPPVKKIPYLAPNRPANARRDLAGIVKTHFASLPPKGSPAALKDFAADGAALLHVRMQSNQSDGAANTLRHAMHTVLDTHAEHHSSLWKRMTKVSPAETEDIMAALVDELVASSHDQDKRKMNVYAAGAIMEAVTSRVVEGKKVGGGEFGALQQGFYAVFGDEMFGVPGQNITKVHLRPRVEWR